MTGLLEKLRDDGDSLDIRERRQIADYIEQLEAAQQPVATSNGTIGTHYYPGCEDKDMFYTSDCANGCGCWMGNSRSGGPDGVDPFGICPEAEHGNELTNQPVAAEPVALARRFHDTYERLAPQFGYETRQDTKQFDPESSNGKLMISVCAELYASPTTQEREDDRTIPFVIQVHGTAFQVGCKLSTVLNCIERAFKNFEDAARKAQA